MQRPYPYLINGSLFFCLIYLGWCLEIVPFLIAGLLLSKRQGVNSILLIIACEPLWLERYLAPEGIPYDLWNSTDPKVQFAWFVCSNPTCFKFSYFTACCGYTYIRSTKTKIVVDHRLSIFYWRYCSHSHNSATRSWK